MIGLPQKKKWIIRHDGNGFYMLDHEGKMVWSPDKQPQNPKKMSKMAFDTDADEVQHDYNLVLAEHLP